MFCVVAIGEVPVGVCLPATDVSCADIDHSPFYAMSSPHYIGIFEM